MAEGLPRKDPKDQGFGFLRMKDNGGNTPLHIAARSGCSDVIRTLLLKNKELLEERNAFGQTALYLAVNSANKEVVECLLDAGADPNIVTDDGSTIWHAAASLGSAEMFSVLSEASATFMASRKNSGNSNQVSNDRKDVKSDKESKDCNNLKAKISNQESADSNIYAEETISDDKGELENRIISHVRLQTRKPAKWEEIYKAADDIDSSSYSEDEEFTEILFPEREIVKEEPEPLFQTPEEHRLDILEHRNKRIRMQLNSSSFKINDVGKRNEEGLTILHIAAMYGAEKCVLRILKRNVDVNVKTYDGQTPFQLSMTTRSERVMELLIYAGADYKHEDDYGRTALHLAANWKHLPAVKLLLALGLDPNHKSNTGQTPLHYAAMMHENTAIVEELLKHGADKSIKNNYGIIPAEYALKTNDGNMFRLLDPNLNDIN